MNASGALPYAAAVIGCTGVLLLACGPARGAPVPRQDLSAAEVRAREIAVLNALDLSRPQLAGVSSAWRKHDLEAAVKALAAYLRQRDVPLLTNESDTPPPSLEQDTKIADAAVRGELRGGGSQLAYHFEGASINWHYNATYHIKDRAPDDEWMWQLNRMSHWNILGRTYLRTHDERYALTFVRELRSWIAQCQVPSRADNSPGSAWRTIEAGIRMESTWPAALYYFRRSPTVTDSDLLLLMQAFLEHAQYLRSHHTRLNWLTMEMAGLYSVGALFPEFRRAEDWRAFASDQLIGASRMQFLPDGGHVELSPAYHNVALQNILAIARVASATGFSSELPADYVTAIEPAFEWLIAIMAPNRRAPRFNDSGDLPLAPVFARGATQLFPDRSDFAWVASGGSDGHPPPYTSRFLDHSGLAVMRSGWDNDDNYMLFRVGPLGLGHAHQDKLNVIAYAYGREIIFDNGGGSYEKSKWREWAVSTYSHSCVIVDNMGQNRATAARGGDPWRDPDLVSQRSLDAAWHSDDRFDFASGEYSEGYGPSRTRLATQQRDVLYIKPDVFVVVDRMRPNDSRSHTYQARWQLLSSTVRVDAASKTAQTSDANQPNVAIVPLAVDTSVRAVSAQEQPEILGWNIRMYSEPRRLAATTLTHSIVGKGPKVLLTMILPLRPGARSPVASVQSQPGGGGATVRLTNGRSLEIAVATPRGLRVKELDSNGSLIRDIVAGAP